MRRWITQQSPWLMVVTLVAAALALHIHTAFAAGSPEEATAPAVLVEWFYSIIGAIPRP